MKFDFHKFLDVVKVAAPVILPFVPGGPVIATLLPVMVHAIGEAEASGKSGPEKKAHVLSVVADAVTIANATGKVSLDPADVQATAGAAVDAVIGTVKAIQDAHPKG